MSQDLSSAFGESATSRLRGLLPPRSTRESSPNGTGGHAGDHAGDQAGDQTAGEAPDQGDDPVADGADGAAAPDGPAVARPRPTPSGGSSEVSSGSSSGARSATASTRSARTAPRAAVSSTNRRWGMARVASREHVDLLVLCALRDGPAGARGIIERLRADSGGLLEAPERTVHNTLHRLARNRLLHRVHAGTTGGPHYGLTPTGERAARARARQWRMFARAVEAVVREPDPR